MAAALAPLVRHLLGEDLPVAIRCWDGSRLGPGRAPATVVVRSPRALRRLLWAPGELGLARAYVAGDLDLEGDVFALVGLDDVIEGRGDGRGLSLGVTGARAAWQAARRLGALGPPPAPPAEEARRGWRRHTPRGDAGAISHHYDVSNDFYRLVLDEEMVYSCAYFASAEMDLAAAQRAKFELVCRKLGLRPGMRLLDVGCGWGGLVLHAARHHGVQAVGITLSRAQQELAAKRVAEAGLGDQIRVERRDYRDIDDGPYDAIASIGMFEHVGAGQARAYFDTLFQGLASRGRLLNHAIARPPGTRGVHRRSFINRYVFPDSELLELGRTITAMQESGFEVRDVESLREHYARTLRCWVANLESNWPQAQRLAGPARARTWRLYMAGCCRNFEHGQLGVNQVLAVKRGPGGASGMPAHRTGMVLTSL
ncbi:MAG TPA: cyclopropane-fatty-acyl-phospholipid synthase family protein [Acidimicrobiales bacterium]|nr:cyclopropane-fatty-acyl-phospholipid synthase family protein [Acidimicrobiales bacterium]